MQNRKDQQAMASTSSEAAPRALRPWYRALVPSLVRRRASVASTGAAVCLVVLLALGASSFWTVRTQQESLETSRRERVRAVATMLGHSLEPLLSSGEVSNVRRLVADTSIEQGLEACRVEFADGSVLAATQASQITALELPERWPTLAADGAVDEEKVEDGEVRIQRVLMVPGKGRALLRVATPAGEPALARSDAVLGAALIAGVALFGLLLAQRRLSRTVRGLEAIRSGLRAVAEGRDARGALGVHPDLAPEAEAWNRVLHERDMYLRREVVIQAAAALNGGGTGTPTENGGTLDALWHGIVVVDHGGRVRFANGAAALLLGLRRDQIVGQELATLSLPKDLQAPLSDVVAGRSRQRQIVEIEGKDPGGDRTVIRASIKPMRKEDPAAAIMVIEDVTQQRIADESRNALVAQATHELRTPLTNIRLYVETLVDEPDADAMTRGRALNVISQEVRRLERIVGDMLSVAEMEAGGLKLRHGDVRLEALFEELREDFRAQAADKEIELIFDMPPKLPVLQGDRDRIVLTLHNLVGNALKYTPAGGRVQVRVLETDGSLRVDVVDNGIGIKPEEHELVFERFYRAKDNRIGTITGSGLGLALARQIARLHGGDITLTSQIDKGSTFSLVLPTSREAARAAA